MRCQGCRLRGGDVVRFERGGIWFSMCAKCERDFLGYEREALRKRVNGVLPAFESVPRSERKDRVR